MFEIIKEKVNGGGNIVESSSMLYVDCTPSEIYERLVKPFASLAKAETLEYKLSGSSIYIRYKFKLIEHADVNSAILKALNHTKAYVNNANRVVDRLNKAHRASKKNGGNGEDVKKIKMQDFWLSSPPDLSIFSADSSIIIVK